MDFLGGKIVTLGQRAAGKRPFWSVAAIVVLLLMAAACGTGGSRHDVGEQADCPINEGDCRSTLFEGALTVHFEIDPRPVSAMAPLRFGVTLKEGEREVEDAGVALSLTMPGMVMGVNRPVMTHEGSGRYAGDGVIPRCPSGRKLWQAEVTVTRAGQTESTAYRFEVN